MTYFEKVGVDYQYNATNITEATNAFKKSCAICCTTGKHINCDSCAISNVHSTLLSILKPMS